MSRFWQWLKVEINLWYRAFEPFRTPERTLSYYAEIRRHRRWMFPESRNGKKK